MKLILRAISLLFINSYILSQITLPKNVDIEKLKKSGIPLEQLQKLKNSKTLNSIESLDQFDRAGDANDNQSISEIRNELKQNYEQDVSLNASNESLSVYANTNSDSSLNIKNKFNPYLKKEVMLEKIDLVKSKYFGYDLFSNNAEFFQRSIDDAIDPNYLLSPGDEIIIMLWGETELNEPYSVTKDGYIFVDNIGQVFVNGLTLSKLEKKLFNILKKVYATLDQGNGIATTFFDVSLGSSVLRPVRIFAVGEVSSSGAYDVKKSTTLYSSLYYFNGPSVKGSLRDIRLMRKGKVVKSIDFYNYLLRGQLLDDIQLQRDDLIFIPLRGKTVSVSGEISRPAIYELNDNETLIALIEIAGGLKETTYMERMQINRIIPSSERKGDGIDRTIIDVSLNDVFAEKEDMRLYNGDSIIFYKINDRVGNVVKISGAVKRPGNFDLGKGLRVSDLVKKADGLLGNAFYERATITRKNKDLTLSNITVDLKSALRNNPKTDIELSSEDELLIYDNSSMIYKTSISVEGHVINPGEKSYKKDMSLEDLVFMGGGFENENHISKTYLDRADLYRWNEGYTKQELIVFDLDSVLSNTGLGNLKIRMGDRVRIYSKEEVLGSDKKSITVSGYIKKPGEFPYLENMTIKDILFISGGLNDAKHMKRMYFDRFDIVRFDLMTNKYNLSSHNLREELITISTKIYPDDKIIFYSKDMFADLGKVSISGAINNEMVFYDLKEKMTIKDLIIESGGVVDSLYYFRVEIASVDPKSKDQNKYADVKVFDLINDESLYSSQAGTYYLRPYDKVIVRPTPFFIKQRTVYVGGSVNYPGPYFLNGPDDKASDIINRAGGLSKDGYPEASIFIRNNKEILVSFKKLIKNPRSKENFVVLAGDSIIIGRRPNIVTITGMVNRPGNFQYIEGKNLKDYIDLAGGYQRNAVRKEAFVIYPDGRSAKGTILSSPKILDGSEIVVPAKDEVEPFDLTTYVTNMTTIWSDITQAYLMIALAMRQN